MKKAKKLFFFVTVIIILLLILAFYFDWFKGLGLGKGFPWNSAESTTTKEESSAENSIPIVIEKDAIYYNGNTEKPLTIEELTSELTEVSKDVEFVLIDKGATLGTYEEVEKILFQNNLKYTEKVEK